MKTVHFLTVAVALVSALFVAWKAPGFVIESPNAQTTESAASRPAAPEQSRRLVPRVTLLTSTALISRFFSPVDPLRQTVLIGRTRVEDMIIQLELEPAKAMPTITSSPPTMAEQGVGKNDLYHVEVTPIDPRSKARIPYVRVTFKAANKNNGREVEAELISMSNRSGLHYAFNSGLAGDGVYESKVIVGVPNFARGPNYQERWLQPLAAKFHFTLAGGKLTEGSEVTE